MKIVFVDPNRATYLNSVIVWDGYIDIDNPDQEEEEEEDSSYLDISRLPIDEDEVASNETKDNAKTESSET